MSIYGYARVSRDGQTLDAQRAALTAAGAVRIFQETASGEKTERKEQARALRALQTSDTLLMTRLDRLARSTRDLLNMLDAIGTAGGQAPTITAHQRQEAIEALRAGRVTQADLARRFNVSQATISRLRV